MHASELRYPCCAQDDDARQPQLDTAAGCRLTERFAQDAEQCSSDPMMIVASQMNPREQLLEAQAAARDGRHEEALGKLIWFHDHALDYDPSLYGVRLSFALRDWIKLADAFPPALEALEAINRQKTSALLAGDCNRALFHDVASINRAMGRTSETVVVFKALSTTAPDFAAQCVSIAQPALLDAEEHALLRRFVRDPTSRLEKLGSRLNEDVAFAHQAESDEVRKPMLDAFMHNYAYEVAGILSMLARTGDASLADELRTRFLATIEDSVAREEIAARLVR